MLGRHPYVGAGAAGQMQVSRIAPLVLCPSLGTPLQMLLISFKFAATPQHSTCTSGYLLVSLLWPFVSEQSINKVPSSHALQQCQTKRKSQGGKGEHRGSCLLGISGLEDKIHSWNGAWTIFLLKGDVHVPQAHMNKCESVGFHIGF